MRPGPLLAAVAVWCGLRPDTAAPHAAFVPAARLSGGLSRRSRAPRRCVGSLRDSQAAWAPEELAGAQWLSASVLQVDLGDSELARRLGRFCLSLEEEGRGRQVSNVGGFQSENLAEHADPALSELLSLTHGPLAAFLQRRYRGAPARGVASADDLRVSASPEHIWANVNRPGHRNRMHEHGPPLLCRAASCIYYPRLEAAAEAAAEAQGQYSPPAAVVRLYDGGSLVEVKPRAGLLLLFPTNLLHEVDPVWPGSAARASVAFNLFVRWLDRPLLRAARAGDVAGVQALLAGGADADAPDGALGLRPAHVAAEAGRLAVLEALVAAGADTEAASGEGWSPLGLAAAQGHLATVRYLAGRGAAGAFARADADAARDAKELDLTGGFAGLAGALAVASERGHGEVVEFLHGLAAE